MTNSELITRVQQDIAELNKMATLEQLQTDNRTMMPLLDGLLQAQHEYYFGVFDKAIKDLFNVGFKDVLHGKDWSVFRLRCIVLNLYSKVTGMPTLRIANLLGIKRCKARYAIIKYEEFSVYVDRTMKSDYEKLETRINELI